MVLLISLCVGLLLTSSISNASAEELIAVTLDTVDQLDNHLDGQVTKFVDLPNTNSPATVTGENGSVFIISGSWGGLQPPGSHWVYVTVEKNHTYWVDAASGLITGEAETDGTTKVNFVFEPIDVVVDAIDQAGNHLDASRVIGGGDASWYDTPHAYSIANGASTSFYVNWNGRQSSRVLTIMKGNTYLIDALTNEIIGEAPSENNEETKVNFVFEPIDVVVDAIDQAGNHLDASRVIGGGDASWYDTPHAYSIANGASTSFYVNWNGRQSSRVLTIMKGNTYLIDALTNEIIGEAPSENNEETKVNFVFETDNQPPQITVSSPADLGLYASGDISFDFSAVDNEGGSGVKSVTATLDDGEPFTSPTSKTIGAGVYHLKVTAEDNAGNMAEEETMFIVYDPEAGFVTGGGWIDSPLGAYMADPSLAGKATFGFVSRYKKGATVPTGQTEFQFKVADLDFHSTSYDWLVLAGSKAQYKGRGAINGLGDYGFMLTATDGTISGDSADKFRIKIWEIREDDTENIVYDNNTGADDGTDSATILGGGKVVIHKK